jgi:L-rhamnose mutarotase
LCVYFIEILKKLTKMPVQRVAFKMQLFAGFEAEYKKRHNELWPELQHLLKETGVSNYSIFLDKTTNSLFAVMDVKDQAALNALPLNPVMQRWWNYMADIMETDADKSPLQVPLEEVFYLL